jgi:hypothetical protein
MLSSSSLCKNKEVLTRNGGGKFGKEMCLILYSMEESHFEHDTLSLTLCLGWKIRSSLDHTPYKITCWSMIPVLESVFPRQLLCRQYVQREFQPKKPSVASTIYAVLKPSIALAIPKSVLNHLLL